MVRRSSKDQSTTETEKVPIKKNDLVTRLKSKKIEDTLNFYKIPITIALIGLILIGLGVFFIKSNYLLETDTIEVVYEPTRIPEENKEIFVEIAGAVVKPGVYKLKSGDRVEDLMTACAGLSAEADREWVEKFINRASKLVDGSKIYIKSIEDTAQEKNSKQTSTSTASNEEGYQTVSAVMGTTDSGLVNINTCTFEDLDNLPGIGRVYGQKIIEQRPYSTVEELFSDKIIPKSTYEKIKDKITVN